MATEGLYHARGNAYSLLMAGKRLLSAGRAAEAVPYLERAAAIEPEKMSIRETLARALFNSGRTVRAEEEFLRVVEAEPVNDYCHFGLALCLVRRGRRGEARGHLRLALALRPEQPDYLAALTLVGG